MLCSLGLNLILGLSSESRGDSVKDRSLFHMNKTGVLCSRWLVLKITQAIGQTCLLTPGLLTLSAYHPRHPSSLSSALSSLTCPATVGKRRKRGGSSRQCLPSPEQPRVRELVWGMGPEMSVLISSPTSCVRTLGMGQPRPA